MKKIDYLFVNVRNTEDLRKHYFKTKNYYINEFGEYLEGYIRGEY